MLKAFLHGFVLAIGLIIAIGPQNMFILTQGATHSRFAKAIPAIITSSISDTILILIAVLGVSLLILNKLWVMVTVTTIGTVFLIYIGWVNWKSSQTHNHIIHTGESTNWPVCRQVVFALSFSLLNPGAIMDTIGVIGTNSLTYSGREKLSFTLATIAVSWIWFALLALTGRIMRKNIAMYDVLNKASAIVMWISAIYMVQRLLTIIMAK